MAWLGECVGGGTYLHALTRETIYLTTISSFSLYFLPAILKRTRAVSRWRSLQSHGSCASFSTIGLWVTSCRFLAAHRSSPPLRSPLAPLSRPKGVTRGVEQRTLLDLQHLLRFSTHNMSGVRFRFYVHLWRAVPLLTSLPYSPSPVLYVHLLSSLSPRREKQAHLANLQPLLPSSPCRPTRTSSARVRRRTSARSVLFSPQPFREMSIGQCTDPLRFGL